ncbi:MAG: YcaO-like family protein [Pseudomonadota bacterium]
MTPNVEPLSLSELEGVDRQDRLSFRDIQPILQSVGISRVADITGLDRLGVPVAQAVRPGARSNTVSQGKGLTLDAAMTAAVLEAVETWAAERVLEQTTTRSNAFKILKSNDFSKTLHDGLGSVQDDLSIFVTSATNLSNGESVHIPTALIDTDYRVDQSPEADLFRRSTTGLGAGASLASATLHALLECVERHVATDTKTFNKMNVNQGPEAENRVYGLTQTLIERDVAVGIWLATPHTDISVARVMIQDRKPGPDQLLAPAVGTAADCDPSRSVERAVLEAIQTRVSVIAGSREDITRRHYAHTMADHRDALEMIDAPGEDINLDTREPTTVDRVLKAIDDMKLGPVFGVTLLNEPSIPLSVVRVVMPNAKWAAHE